MIKTILLYFFGLLSLTGIFSGTASAQSSIDKTGEKVLVHCDKSFYISGQVMWFKIYVTGKQTNQLQAFSKTAYAELTGPDGRPALQGKIELQNGLGAGSFLLPDDAKSGKYELRVYTNLMVQVPSSIFRKPIIFINTLQTFDTTSSFLSVPASEMVLQTENTFPPAFKEYKALVPSPINIVTDKKSYSKRDEVNLVIQTENKQEIISANVSVAVYRETPLTIPEVPVTSLNSGYMEAEPLTQEGQIFLPEVNGFVVVARVKDANGEPVSRVPVTLFLAGKLATARWGESDGEGFVYFNFKNVYGPQQILIKPSAGYGDNIQIEILNSFSRFQEKGSLPEKPFNASLLNSIEEMHNHVQVSKAFYPVDPESFFPENKDSISFYGKADKTYLLDEYRRFVTMEEVLREYVQEVSVRIRNGNYAILVLNKQLVHLSRFLPVEKMMDNIDPLVLIDGLPVSTNQLMQYDPLKIRKLEVLSERYFLGRNIYSGILSFTTYNAQFENVPLDKDALLAEGQGWQYTRKFHMPDYSNVRIKQNRLPDFRELLYWQPQLRTSSDTPGKVSFFTGDLTGKFLVEIHGLSTDGQVIHEISSFEVTGD